MFSIGNFIAFLGLLNGMIGATVLILPLLGIQTGYVLIPCVTLIIGFISFYTCYLLISHMGQSKNVRTMILEHFGNKFSALVIYNSVMSLSMLSVLVIYFQLIVEQVEGLLQKSEWIGLFVLVFLIVLTVSVSYLSFGQRLLAIGALTVVSYVIFFIWIYSTAEYDQKKIDPIGPKYVDLGAVLILGFSIHNFFIQVMHKTATQKNFINILMGVYFGGVLIYIFIGFSGYALINRVAYQSDTFSLQFPSSGWHSRTIQLIFLFHLLSVIPEFCIIMKGKMLEICNLKEEQMEEKENKITVSEIVVYVGTFVICYILNKFEINTELIIKLNGSVIGFFYLFLIPIVIHIKCVYFSDHDESGILLQKIDHEKKQFELKESKCKCRTVYRNVLTRVLELLFQGLILAIAAFIIYSTLSSILGANSKQLQTNNSLKMDDEKRISEIRSLIYQKYEIAQPFLTKMYVQKSKTIHDNKLVTDILFVPQLSIKEENTLISVKDPFEPPFEKGKLIKQLPPFHRLIFSLYFQFDYHIVLPTFEFKNQTDRADLQDFKDILLVTNALKGLFFFNRGHLAGETQKHKHFQMLPEEQLSLPIIKLIIQHIEEQKMINSYFKNKENINVYYFDPFQFIHGVIILPTGVENLTLEQSAREYYKYYNILMNFTQKMLNRTEFDYNMLGCNKFLIIIPRKSDSAYEKLFANALWFMGNIHIRDGNMFQQLIRVNRIMDIFKNLTFSSGNESTHSYGPPQLL